MQAVFQNSDRLERELIEFLSLLQIIGIDHLLEDIILMVVWKLIMFIQSETLYLAGIVSEGNTGHDTAGLIRTDIALIALDAEVVWSTAILSAYRCDFEFPIVHDQNTGDIDFLIYVREVLDFFWLTKQSYYKVDIIDAQVHQGATGQLVVKSRKDDAFHQTVIS